MAARLLLSVSSKAVTPVEDSYKSAGLQETLQGRSGKAVTHAI
jgi:hypothetical protein